MRIGVNALFYRPTEVGGSETYLLELLHRMMQETQGHEWVLFTNLENHDFLSKRFGGERRVSFVPLRFRAGNRVSRMFWEQIVLPLKVPAQRLDLLWSPGYVLPVFVRRPQVLTVFDMQTRSFPDDFHAVAAWAMNILVSLGCRLSSRVLTTSQFSKMEIIRFTRVSERRIGVTPLATTEAFAQGSLSEARARLARDLPNLKHPYLLCVSFSHPHKNLPRLVEAFGKLSREIPHQLVLVGRPARGERALQEAIERQTPGRVLRFPYVSQETLVALYQAAELFVMPSLYEGFGLPVLEAMMAGVPVVATRSASILEVGGEAVTYFDAQSPDDLCAKIRQILSLGPDVRKRMTESARERAREFSWGRTARETLMCFETAAGHL